MKIGIIAPLVYTVPPKGYGGTETVIYHLTEGLVKNGHDVTLFACDGSQTSAKLESFCNEQTLGANTEKDGIIYNLERINHIIGLSDNFDIIHNHDGFFTLSMNRYFKCPFVSTFHFSPNAVTADNFAKKEILRRNKLVSISYAQQKSYKDTEWVGNVYHGTTELDQYTLGQGGEDLVWIGRFNPYKGVEDAIAIAERSNHKLIIAGSVEKGFERYFEEEIKPKIDNKSIVYIGEISLSEKIKLLKEAKALLMPIKWDEPFGLVMTEAMACGTPVIAYDRGSASEIVEDGQTGFIIPENDIPAAVEAVKSVSGISRDACRERVRRHFSIEGMVTEYEKLYKELRAADESRI